MDATPTEDAFEQKGRFKKITFSSTVGVFCNGNKGKTRMDHASYTKEKPTESF